MLRITGLRKTFGDTVAVDGMDLHVRRGEVFGLLGPNGAGKSTTVSTCVGLLRPDAGTVRVALDEDAADADAAESDAADADAAGPGWGDPRDPEVRRRIGLAPQSVALYDDLTARENLRLFGGLHGLAGGDLRERTDWALDFTGLAERADRRVTTFSGGMKRRLNLGTALMHDPRLVLLDEPTVGVDPQSRNAIFECIERLRDDGSTIIYTTHYMEEAERLCDRVAIMDHGRLPAIGTVAELLDAHAGPGTLVLETPDGERRITTDEPVTELRRVTREEGEDAVLGFRLERGNLEQVFLHLTGHTLRDA